MNIFKCSASEWLERNIPHYVFNKTSIGSSKVKVQHVNVSTDRKLEERMDNNGFISDTRFSSATKESLMILLGIFYI